MPARSRKQTSIKTGVGVTTKSLTLALAAFIVAGSAFIAAPAARRGSTAVPRGVSAAVFPDLIVQNVAVRKVDNIHRRLTFEVKNIGEGVLQNQVLPVTVFTVTANNTRTSPFASSARTTLSSGQARSYTVDFDIAHSFEIQVDRNNTILESNEQNNNFNRETDLYPDIVIEDVLGRRSANGNTEISFKVVNRGNVVTNAPFSVSVARPRGLQGLNERVNSLDVGESRTLTYTMRDASNVRISANAPQVVEINTENNSVTKSFTPDLWVSAEVTGHENIKDIRVEVKNTGSVDMIQGSDVKTYRVFGNRESLEFTDNVRALQAGETQVFTHRMPEVDVVMRRRADAFKFSVDTQNQIMELHEDDNTYTYPFLRPRN